MDKSANINQNHLWQCIVNFTRSSQAFIRSKKIYRIWRSLKCYFVTCIAFDILNTVCLMSKRKLERYQTINRLSFFTSVLFVIKITHTIIRALWMRKGGYVVKVTILYCLYILSVLVNVYTHLYNMLYNLQAYNVCYKSLLSFFLRLSLFQSIL